MRSFFGFFLLCLAVFCVGACSVTDRVTYVDEEGPVSEDIIKKIKKKNTEKSWVVAHLGDPFAIDRVETSGKNPITLYEVYTYRFAKTHARAGHLFYIFRAGATQEEVEYFHVAFEQDLVQRAWIDDFARAQLGDRIRQEKVKTVVVASPDDVKGMAPEKNKRNWKLPILKKWFGQAKSNASENSSSMMSTPDDRMVTEKQAINKEDAMSEDMNKDAQN